MKPLFKITDHWLFGVLSGIEKTLEYTGRYLRNLVASNVTKEERILTMLKNSGDAVIDTNEGYIILDFQQKDGCFICGIANEQGQVQVIKSIDEHDFNEQVKEYLREIAERVEENKIEYGEISEVWGAGRFEGLKEVLKKQGLLCVSADEVRFDDKEINRQEVFKGVDKEYAMDMYLKWAYRFGQPEQEEESESSLRNSLKSFAMYGLMASAAVVGARQVQRFGGASFSTGAQCETGLVFGGLGAFATANPAFMGLGMLMCAREVSAIQNSTFATMFAGVKNNYAQCVQQTSNGGYIVVGTTMSVHAGNGDALVMKLDSTGNKIWSKGIGSIYTEELYSIQQTADGGYLTAGHTSVRGGLYGTDALVIKLDSAGSKIWSTTYGTSGAEQALSIQPTTDGGHIVVGYVYSTWTNALVMKLNSTGSIIWSKKFGENYNNYAHSVQQTNDGGYIVAAKTYTASDINALVVKLDSAGNRVWGKRFAGCMKDLPGGDWTEARAVRQTSDNGYVVAGYTNCPKSWTAFVMKFDSAGNKLWDKAFNPDGLGMQTESLQQTRDGGYILTGFRFVIKLDSLGNIVWSKTFGGNVTTYGHYIQQVSDGGYVIAGQA